jgi:hypothetical protein
MSRSVTMHGTGRSSSVTSAAPIPFSTIIVAASRSVCDGPTVRITSDIPSRTCILVALPSQLAGSCQSPQSYPTIVA